ncbi:hypothetical protein KIW84_071093 [Lathyrus oleraceus]|uniref:Cellular nucleic acid-binding protein n=1 Tax=Pisum sativum TaxID=3888 RepID=A0A9D4VII2_PEA|nr:hypothetical protein KIW84_071093 [Pisum sativum]
MRKGEEEARAQEENSRLLKVKESIAGLTQVLCNPISTYCFSLLGFRIEMAGRGRDDAAIAEALGMLAGVLGGDPNIVGMGTARQLSEFQKNNPPMFKGAYDPDGAQKWLKEIERIFRVTECADN